MTDNQIREHIKSGWPFFGVTSRGGRFWRATYLRFRCSQHQRAQWACLPDAN